MLRMRNSDVKLTRIIVIISSISSSRSRFTDAQNVAFQPQHIQLYIIIGLHRLTAYVLTARYRGVVLPELKVKTKYTLALQLSVSSVNIHYLLSIRTQQYIHWATIFGVLQNSLCSQTFFSLSQIRLYLFHSCLRPIWAAPDWQIIWWPASALR